MDTSKWFPKGSRRRWCFGFALTFLGLIMGTMVVDTYMRGGFPLQP